MINIFCSDRYLHRDTKYIDLNPINAPIHSQEDSNMLERKITEAKAFATLGQMKNNKSQGSDGFAAELYHIFRKNIGTCLVRSVNHGFDYGEMSVTQRQVIILGIPQRDKPKRFLKNWRHRTLLNTSHSFFMHC